ncbi:hypothetical protein T310_3029 [Rasamsonia emersonii CBS 393.64]|uniref:Uncharacterized protein n=1 Tax=Rasamsonia emersonii (strain ATCC 16479 / CBS 393.64 / IMI 116815) TaxID=1408163 RepID=A0A0F4YX85_RASE3|nr:hypothetical protein T310_3029 [Rasamsonia emersonii CBS 393.64]KKA22922.1 hypothetical protein T310_3029 [Rasamsonia emersonii CBS 393.64]
MHTVQYRSNGKNLPRYLRRFQREKIEARVLYRYIPFIGTCTPQSEERLQSADAYTCRHLTPHSRSRSEPGQYLPTTLECDRRMSVCTMSVRCMYFGRNNDPILSDETTRL